MADFERFEVRAIARHIQITPQKARLVVDAVRGMDARRALDTLRFMPNRAAEPAYKLILSAVANAEENYGLEIDELFISRIFVDEGPSMRRWKPRAKGRVNHILKRTSHVTVMVGDK